MGVQSFFFRHFGKIDKGGASFVSPCPSAFSGSSLTGRIFMKFGIGKVHPRTGYESPGGSVGIALLFL